VDVGFIGGVVPGNADALRALRDAGVFAFKCFLVPSGVDEFANVGEADLNTAMPEIARGGATLMVHSELPGPLLQAMRGATGDPRRYATWLASRPPESETAAVAMMIELAERHRCRVHIVHVSAAESVALIARARARGVQLTAETCPHYLSIEASDIPDGATEFKCAPPIRDRAHRDALWTALGEKTLDCIVSDHSPSPPSMKQGDFMSAWGGIASLELGLPVIWTAVRERGHTPAHLARWMSEAPARLFGLTNKGALASGRDADVAIVDLDASFSVDPQALQQRHKLTPYAGRALRGRVAATYLRGQLAYAAERGFTGARGMPL
jgi:allantoinase